MLASVFTFSFHHHCPLLIRAFHSLFHHRGKKDSQKEPVLHCCCCSVPDPNPNEMRDGADGGVSNDDDAHTKLSTDGRRTGRPRRYRREPEGSGFSSRFHYTLAKWNDSRKKRKIYSWKQPSTPRNTPERNEQTTELPTKGLATTRNCRNRFQAARRRIKTFFFHDE